MLKPIIGSPVHYYPHAEHRRRHGYDPQAAFVTKVHRDGASVNLVAFDADGHSSGAHDVPFDRRDDKTETKFDPKTHWCGWAPDPEEFKDAEPGEAKAVIGAKAETPEEVAKRKANPMAPQPAGAQPVRTVGSDVILPSIPDRYAKNGWPIWDTPDGAVTRENIASPAPTVFGDRSKLTPSRIDAEGKPVEYQV